MPFFQPVMLHFRGYVMFSQPDAPDVMLLVFCFSTSIIPKRSHDRIEIDNCIFAKTGGTCMSFLLLLFAVDRWVFLLGLDLCWFVGVNLSPWNHNSPSFPLKKDGWKTIFPVYNGPFFRWHVFIFGGDVSRRRWSACTPCNADPRVAWFSPWMRCNVREGWREGWGGLHRVPSEVKQCIWSEVCWQGNAASSDYNPPKK